MSSEAAGPFTVTAETRVGELIARWPESVEILVQAGFAPLADAAHREFVKKLPVTVAMAMVWAP